MYFQKVRKQQLNTFQLPKKNKCRGNYTRKYDIRTNFRLKTSLNSFASLYASKRALFAAFTGDYYANFLVIWCPEQTTRYVYSFSRFFPGFIAYLELLFITEITLHVYLFLDLFSLLCAYLNSHLFGKLEYGDGNHKMFLLFESYFTSMSNFCGQYLKITNFMKLVTPKLQQTYKNAL